MSPKTNKPLIRVFIHDNSLRTSSWVTVCQSISAHATYTNLPTQTAYARLLPIENNLRSHIGVPFSYKIHQLKKRSSHEPLPPTLSQLFPQWFTTQWNNLAPCGPCITSCRAESCQGHIHDTHIISHLSHLVRTLDSSERPSISGFQVHQLDRAKTLETLNCGLAMPNQWAIVQFMALCFMPICPELTYSQRSWTSSQTR